MPYKTLDEMDKDCRQCTLCPLRKTATQVVPGEGDPHANVMFIGEGPGATEDKLGRPFVGAAGKFLDELLKSIGLERSSVFIANMVKCRPPQNREPLPAEKDACKPWLDEQIRLINPKIFVPLGRHALGKFIPDISISSAHGSFFKATSDAYRGRIVFAMYHPAVALYNGGMRKTLLDDMQNLKKFLDRLGDKATSEAIESYVAQQQNSKDSSAAEDSGSAHESDRVKAVKEILKKKEQTDKENAAKKSNQMSLF